MREYSFPPYKERGVKNLVHLSPTNSFNRLDNFPLLIRPSAGFQRGVAEGVVISWKMIDPLCLAQDLLSKEDPNLTIVLKRGFFQETPIVRVKTRVAEAIFSTIYPERAHEAPEIFDNRRWGHFQGLGADLGLMLRKENFYLENFLPPFNAFSPQNWIEKYYSDPKIGQHYNNLKMAVEGAGLSIHPHPIEARQMHVYMRDA